MDVLYEGKLSLQSLVSLPIRKFIWETNLTFVVNVEKALLRRGVLLDIIELIPVRNPSYAVSVGKVSH